MRYAADNSVVEHDVEHFATVYHDVAEAMNNFTHHTGRPIDEILAGTDCPTCYFEAAIAIASQAETRDPLEAAYASYAEFALDCGNEPAEVQDAWHVERASRLA